MYHEVTYAEIARRRRRSIAYAALVAVIIVALGFSLFSVMNMMRQQASESVRQAVVARAAQCLAVEGSYPSSLQHLEDEYGLVVNHADYDVSYEWLGDNVPPSVVVRLR